jgi:hypothetical protein
MLSVIATLIMMLVLVLFPVLIPATVTALHALARLRGRRTNSRIVLARVEPIPASA